MKNIQLLEYFKKVYNFTPVSAVALSNYIRLKKMEEDNKNGQGGIGCFIVTFLVIASGIPMAIKGEGPVGTIVIVLGGLALAYYLAKTLSGRDR